MIDLRNVRSLRKGGAKDRCSKGKFLHFALHGFRRKTDEMMKKKGRKMGTFKSVNPGTRSISQEDKSTSLTLTLFPAKLPETKRR